MDHSTFCMHSVGAAVMAVTIAVKQWKEYVSLLLEDAPKKDQEAVEYAYEQSLVVVVMAAQCNIATCTLFHRQRKPSAIGEWYVKPRNAHFWQTFFQYTEGDAICFEENLKIPRSCFEFICNLLHADLQQKPIPTQIAEAVPTRILPVDKKVAMSLHLLGIGGPIHNIANIYSLGHSTVSRVFRQFIMALLKHRATFIHWPRSLEEMQRVKDGFEEKQGFPYCCGALDVTHINMELPEGEAHAHWYDRNHSYSMTLQTVVDSDMRFLNVMSGMPGMCNDIRILRNSLLYSKAQDGVILNGPPVEHAGHRIREYIVTDGGYLDLPWLVSPFSVPGADVETQRFNFKLSSTHIVVERNFGGLQAVLSRVGKANECTPFTYSEVRSITNNFRKQLGVGGFGPVYYGELPDQHPVAVKVLSAASHQGEREFLNEVNLLSRIHHKNLVTLLGYCAEEKLVLIYEYMSNGSLIQALHGKSKFSILNTWKDHLRVAVDAAEGLEYLHNGCNPAIIHRDVKSSNILLSQERRAKLSDFGISRSKLATSDEVEMFTAVQGSVGYLDPE
ncbi:hypothetical protein L7F22_051977 [Adiantum nelumboides]|nr:hypothetical protein [Adiantum nelumboides]